MPGAEHRVFAKSMSQTMISPEFLYSHIARINYKINGDKHMSSKSKNYSVSMAGQVHAIVFT